jgi:hypothetical protein
VRRVEKSGAVVMGQGAVVLCERGRAGGHGVRAGVSSINLHHVLINGSRQEKQKSPACVQRAGGVWAPLLCVSLVWLLFIHLLPLTRLFLLSILQVLGVCT